MEYLVKFTHAQGGGKKHASTSDHLFILRAVIDLSIAKKKPTFLTFYDVSKAYDNVDNEDLMVTMWDKGLRGKAWRILNNLNSNLSAVVKTRFGPSREFKITRSLDLSRVRRHFQKKSGRQTDKHFFFKKTFEMAIYSTKFLFYHSDIKSA